MEANEFQNTETNDGPAFDYIADLIDDIIAELQKQSEVEL